MEKLTGSVHAGDWRVHHISLPEGPGDFTSIRRDAHQEEAHGALEGMWDLLSGLMTGESGPEHEQKEPGE
jgi:hypothetical protein